MTIIRVPIVRWVDDHNPGWVECALTDVAGLTWSLVDKLPIFSEDVNLDANSNYPQPGELACEIVGEEADSRGRKIIIIDTRSPWGVEAVDGTTRFHVLPEQVEIV